MRLRKDLLAAPGALLNGSLFASPSLAQSPNHAKTISGSLVDQRDRADIPDRAALELGARTLKCGVIRTNEAIAEV